MAEAGADIIAVDICDQIKSNKCPLATQEDLDQTSKLVTAFGTRIVAVKADARERDQLRAELESGISDFGRLDIVVANAEILPMAVGDPHASDFVDATDVDLLGVTNAVAVSIAHPSDGGSIIVIGSTAGMMPNTTSSPVLGPGVAGYAWSKNTIIGYVEEMSMHLASRFIRVNAIHPTNVNTHLMHNDGMYRVFRPDLNNHPRGCRVGVHLFPSDADSLHRARGRGQPGGTPGQ
jgi:NAD(P)-dependent dehydrogenase (short-subunit alcohol dehydrogenase family)